MADDLLQQLNNLTPEQLIALIQQAGTIKQQKEAEVQLRGELSQAETESTELYQSIALLKTRLGELEAQLQTMQATATELIGIFEG
jgi:predicted  nucleic acid-binding Zn-ribbon protein